MKEAEHFLDALEQGDSARFLAMLDRHVRLLHLLSRPALGIFVGA
jgi:DNA-binding GntR family transcriptional regulator